MKVKCCIHLTDLNWDTHTCEDPKTEPSERRLTLIDDKKEALPQYISIFIIPRTKTH